MNSNVHAERHAELFIMPGLPDNRRAVMIDGILKDPANTHRDAELPSIQPHNSITDFDSKVEQVAFADIQKFSKATVVNTLEKQNIFHTPNASESTLASLPLSQQSTIFGPSEPDHSPYHGKIAETRQGLEDKGFRPWAAKLLARAEVRLKYGMTKETASRNIQEKDREIAKFKEEVLKRLGTRSTVVDPKSNEVKLDMARETQPRDPSRGVMAEREVLTPRRLDTPRETTREQAQEIMGNIFGHNDPFDKEVKKAIAAKTLGPQTEVRKFDRPPRNRTSRGR